MLKGSHRSDEEKQIMRERRLGKNNPMFGRHQSAEACKKISEAGLGRIPWNKGKTDLPHCSEETIKKIKKALTGKRRTEETKQKMRKPKSDIARQKQSDTRKKKFKDGSLIIWNKGKKGVMVPPWNKGKKDCFSEETIQKMSKARLGKPLPEPTKVKMRDNWKNEEYARKMMELRHAKPNGQELYLDFLLQNYFPDEWKFVGDGQVIINGLCPDFINVDGKKLIIEVFGEYWHKTKKNIRYNYTEEGRKKLFSEMGYTTLIIWEYELVDEQKVIDKIKRYMGE